VQPLLLGPRLGLGRKEGERGNERGRGREGERKRGKETSYNIPEATNLGKEGYGIQDYQYFPVSKTYHK
jgi:hypothetical protein